MFFCSVHLFLPDKADNPTRNFKSGKTNDLDPLLTGGQTQWHGTIRCQQHGLSFGRGQTNHRFLMVQHPKNDDLGRYFLCSVKYRIHLPLNSFSSKIIGSFDILFPRIIFSSKLTGPNYFSTRLWYVFEGLQNHHFLMV